LFDDAALREQGVKLVNFWASWCAPCRVEHPKLEQLAAEGIPIYGVNYIGADAPGRMALDWGLYGVPETYVIDGDGTVILRFAGPVTDSVLERTIRPAIEAASR